MTLKSNTLEVEDYNFPLETFIGGWQIPEHVCDGIIQYFYKNEDKTVKGIIGDYEGTSDQTIDTNYKDSIDLMVRSNDGDAYMLAYEYYLGACLEQYKKKYKMIDNNYYFSLFPQYNIQYYKKGGGFKSYHFERTGPMVHEHSSGNRVLVFMTYLNDVDDGGTEFFYQKLTTPAKKGLTLIWPTDFTHTHRGVISQTKEKYIVTGWYSYDTPN